ncbi:CdiA C-terminal domain-containing protein, partial [Microcoleus sp. B4-C1]
YLPGEYEVTGGSFHPEGTGTQMNNLPEFGEAPRLNKAPKQDVPPDLVKPPKPSDDIWQLPTVIFKEPQFKEVFGSSGSDSASGGTGNDDLANNPSGGSGGGGSSPNQDKIQKFLREFRRVMAQGKRAVIDFLKGFIYHSLINGVGILKDVADLLYPPGAKSHAEIEAYYRNNLSFQLGKAVANGLTFLAGILGILLIGLTIGGSGGSALIAAPAQAAALIAAGNMTAASARDILSLVGQVFQMTSGNSGGSSSIPNPDRTRPSLNPDPNRQPSGSKTIPEPKADELNIRGIARENESAEILSKAGYNVEQNPTVSGTRRPDYKIEGRIFDCYAPITSDPNKIISALKDKIVKGQADRFILNLDDSKVSLADILVHLNRYPAPSIREIIVVRGGTILHFFQ